MAACGLLRIWSIPSGRNWCKIVLWENRQLTCVKHESLLIHKLTKTMGNGHVCCIRIRVCSAWIHKFNSIKFGIVTKPCSSHLHSWNASMLSFWMGHTNAHTNIYQRTVLYSREYWIQVLWNGILWNFHINQILYVSIQMPIESNRSSTYLGIENKLKMQMRCMLRLC